MLELLLKELLANFREYVLMVYDAYRAAQKEELGSRISGPPMLSGKNLVYTRLPSFRPLGSWNGIPDAVAYNTDIIISVDTKQDLIIVTKIKEPKSIYFDRFNYLNCFCKPGTVFRLPNNSEDFILRL